MLTYADVCGRMLTYAVVHSLVDEYGESLMAELAPSIAGMLAVR